MRKLFLSLLLLLIAVSFSELASATKATYPSTHTNALKSPKKTKNDVTYCQDLCGSNPNIQAPSSSGCTETGSCSNNCDCSPPRLCDQQEGVCQASNLVLCSDVNCPSGTAFQGNSCQEPYGNHVCSSNCDCSPGRTCKNGLCAN